ncbi:tyrosine-type recombinase/integrase [Natroniella sulfidigena]|uniref:tyrosine-type recombinase/integrase n=1 Tax=Natroniella sulfidigena TaxID=723921 RepID=UPI00200AC6A6|nr:tyrosine-type recombinase/integrase [Natroniella sulfidigena]MCK8816600.1 tyrosine-type recombinase/integrase [Natroniella sulfidigena]
MVTNLSQLKPITDDVDFSNITIGNSNFNDDIWDLIPFVQNKTLKKSQKKLNFSYIQSEDMKLTVKQYAYYKLGKVKPRTVKGKINGHLPFFINYCEENNISSFSQVNQKILLDYVEKLKQDDISRSHGYQCTLVVQDIIKTGQTKGWNVPKDNFKNINACEIWKPQKNRKSRKTKPIPKDIFNKIVNCAVNEEKNVLTKAGIIIQSQTGLRISEVLSIKEGCIKTTDDGNDYMELTLSKTEKEPITHKVFVNGLVKDTVKELEEYTRDLREESGLKELFLYKWVNKIRPLKVTKFNENRIKTFIKRHDIRDKEGNLYPLHTHQFRATYVRELVKKKIPIGHIKKHFDHLSLEMTSHYLTLEQKEVKDIYGEMILDPNSKLAGKRAKEIENTLAQEFQGKTEEEIDEIIEGLSKSMSFNPLPAGVCLYDFRRGNCTDGDGCFVYNCPNYITEITFYPVLKKELDLLEREMERFKDLGRKRDYQRRKIKHKHLKPLVEDLEEEMELSDLRELEKELDKGTYERLEVKINE